MSESLNDGDRVVVVGGGPAGAFFALHLLREAQRLVKSLDVCIIERKKLIDGAGDKEPWMRKGCSGCAGGISPRLHEILEKDGIEVPESLIEEEFSHVWIQSPWKNIPLKVPGDMRMYSVFRGSLPRRGSERSAQRERSGCTGGFDAFLLGKAVEEGARIVSGEVVSVDYDACRRPRLAVRASHGGVEYIRADFAAISCGIAPPAFSKSGGDGLTRSIRTMNPAFVPVKTRKALVFELELGRDYLTKSMSNDLYFIEYGSREMPLEHIALVPKGDLLTVALLGKAVDRASLPGAARGLVDRFLALPHIQRILPSVSGYDTRVACACSPVMAVKPARNPFAHRLALIGDAVGARLYKDGLFSAHATARGLAMTILHEGVDAASLERGYGRIVKWLHTDNWYGRQVFGLIRRVLKEPILSRVVYQAFANEMRIKDKSRRPLGMVLWKIASGTAHYREVFREMFSLPVWRSIVHGGILLTLRNYLAEVFFGLSWGRYGRYPTVIVREKRGFVKESVSAPLGIALDDSPDFERMFAIKIRAPAAEVFRELGKFGDEMRSYLNLRFVDIRRTAGEPNSVGSVVTYSTVGSALAVDMRLTRCIPDRSILYEINERFADRGRLLFDIAESRDGNIRLIVYAAFDFKKGKTVLGRAFWKLFKLFFPAYVHDVVWNHALCSMKETIESRMIVKRSEPQLDCIPPRERIEQERRQPVLAGRDEG